MSAFHPDHNDFGHRAEFLNVSGFVFDGRRFDAGLHRRIRAVVEDGPPESQVPTRRKGPQERINQPCVIVGIQKETFWRLTAALVAERPWIVKPVHGRADDRATVRGQRSPEFIGERGFP